MLLSYYLGLLALLRRNELRISLDKAATPIAVTDGVCQREYARREFAAGVQYKWSHIPQPFFNASEHLLLEKKGLR